MKSTQMFKAISCFFSKHEQEILLGMGISGMIFSTISAVKATPKAVRLIDARKNREKKEKLTVWETCHTVWKLYIPAVSSAVASIPCIIYSNHIANKKTAALAAAYSVSETVLQEYQEATKEIVGAKKEQEIHEEVTRRQVEKTYPNSEVVITGDGDSLFYEPLSGRYFKSNWNKISRAANELNHDALQSFGSWIDLNDWFYAIGLDSTVMGSELGWDVGDKMIDISYDSHRTPEATPCGAIFYHNMPTVMK